LIDIIGTAILQSTVLFGAVWVAHPATVPKAALELAYSVDVGVVHVHGVMAVGDAYSL